MKPVDLNMMMMMMMYTKSARLIARLRYTINNTNKIKMMVLCISGAMNPMSSFAGTQNTHVLCRQEYL
jgi:hypothetical protein